ncbi:hypothetical protein [Natrarchaeobaculum sulfurireducens]|uniref:hypothetical protein n=1 Tax=Natrarchaeobaculum sulfurireducens TaxID=2044521 RepID=UPI00105AB04A|nr:hypothetical protein [Natrarchaeobaculum sulfurireducens]
MRKFDNWCEREGHVNGGDKGRHAEQAIIEYLPPDYRPVRFRDDLDELEANLRADLDEVGHLTGDSSLKVTPTSRSDNETVKLTYRIAEDVQESLERYVYDQEGKVRGVVGQYVATALDEYRDGGQTARVRRYYERLRESVDMVSEDRVGAIVQTLRDKTGDRDYYNIEEIRLAVDEALDVHSDDVRDDFSDRVIKRLGFVAVKTSNGVYATPERAEQMVHEQAVDSDLHWYLMDKEDRVEFLIEAVKARAQQPASGAGVDYNQVRDEVFEGHPSNDYCYELMELAGEYPGYEYDRHNGKLMLRYTGENNALVSESADKWVDNALKLVKEFCDEAEMDLAQVSQPVLDNRIARAKFPDDYDEVLGPSDQAIEAVTEDDRKRILNQLTSSSNHNEVQIRTERNRLVNITTLETEPVTDGEQL